jgi:hypothetical protein
MKAIQTNLSTRVSKIVDISYKIYPSEYINHVGEPVIQFIGGPTGYESYYLKDIKDMIMDDNETRNFCICFGTIFRYNRMEIEQSELRQLRPIINKIIEQGLYKI